MQGTWFGGGRSGLSLTLALGGGILFLVLVALFNLDYAFREPLIRWGFPLDALAFHVGLGVALWARFGDPAKRGPRTGWAIVANATPVLLFWVMVYGLVQALRCFGSC